MLSVFVLNFSLTCYYGSYICAILTGITGAILGGFGHNFIHQPNYRRYGYTLDLLGLNSEAWITEHNLQHHMYTNTPLDNHFEGTAPFLIVDPTRHRTLFQKACAIGTWCILFFGVWGNYFADLSVNINNIFDVKHKNHKFARMNILLKCIFPIEIAILIYFNGLLHGLLLAFTFYGTVGIYYFTIALSNHNTDKAWDLNARHNAKDWGEAQLVTSSDIDVGSSFYGSMKYLWLNYHTVHHLFPHIDMYHHPAIQSILIETCKEFHVNYFYDDFKKMVTQTIHSFHSPKHLGQTIISYI